MKFSKHILIIVSLIFISGCQTLESLSFFPKKEENNKPLFRRGIIFIEGDAIYFRACYSDKKEAVSGKTTDFEERFEKLGEPSFYAELNGKKLIPGEPWRIQNIYLMGGDSLACRHQLKGSDFVASGENPSWKADLREDGIYVQDYKHFTAIKFPRDAAIKRGESSFEWISHTQGDKKYDLDLKIIKQACRDTYKVDYSYSAVMVLNGREYKGCAREGNLEVRTLAGLYSSVLTDVEDMMRFISLDLRNDYSALLIQDYRNNQPLVSQRGHWERLPTGKIVVNLEENTGHKENEILIFELSKTGTLSLQGYSNTYGNYGLSLQRVDSERDYRSLEFNQKPLEGI